MTTSIEQTEPLYRDPNRPVEERVADLLGRMTLDEKVAQLGSRWVFELADASGLVEERVTGYLAHGLGQVTRISGASSLEPGQAAALANAIQTHLLQHTRLGIPAIVHEEICSGLMARGATVFPQAIGLASTWEPGLVEQLATTIRVQMRAAGAHHGLGPVLDVSRDPRWGRTEETFGEDAHLVARMGVAFVRGLQGDDLATGVVATGKHFIGYGASEGGRNWGPPAVGPRLLRDVYLHPFQAAIREAGLRSVMNAYNELDGIPCGADRSLLTDLLRDELGFEGYVVSDYFSVRQLEAYHRHAPDGSTAAAQALRAGIDVELPSSDCYAEPLFAALEAGLVDTEDIDISVRRILRTKFELGLFEQPLVDVEAAASAAATDAHRALARRVAVKSMVLLRNDGALPLAGDGVVAVIGPSADEARHLLGDYAYPAHVESLADLLESGGEGEMSELPIPILGGVTLERPTVDATSVLVALRERLGERVRFERGCNLNDDDRSGIAAAVELARDADIAVVVVGDKAGLTDDCTSGESRDRASLDLPGVQEELVRAVVETGTPVVLVLVAGRPTGSVWAHEHAAAVLLAWLPGEEGGKAIADVLTGDAAPGGRLPLTFPRSAGQIPAFYGHKISGGRSHWKGDYVDLPAAPLYPFGHGLAYTSFELRSPRLAASDLNLDGTLSVTVEVANTGGRAGDEVVQLYVRDPEASVTRPVLELKAFARVALDPGESRAVVLEVPVAALGFTGVDLSYVVEPGAIDVFLGTDAATLTEVGTVTIAAAAVETPEPSSDGKVAVE
jgi:beta-glucosidase